MKMKRYLSLLLAGTLALALTACGGGETSTAGSETGSTTTSASQSAANAGTTEEITGTVNTDGSTSMESVAKALGEAFMELNPGVTVNYSGTGSGTGIQSVIVKEDSTITKIDDLQGKKIGVQLSTTGDIYATDDFGKDSVVQYNKGNDAVMALTQGQVDAVIIDNEPAKSYVAANKGLKILDTEYATENYAACIAKDNTGLTKAVNKALAELKADGTLQKIVDKYIKA